MLIEWSAIYWLLGAVLVIGAVLWTGVRTVRRWKRSMDVGDDASYAAALAVLSDGSARRGFNPYTDIDWNAPDFSVTANDPRWVLSDPMGRHPWYRAQPVEKQIAMGMWCQANTAKVALQFESILVAGLMNYTLRVPNGSPEHRYCLHESAEECNHTLMFQEVVNRIGVDVPGMPRWLRLLSPILPIYAGLLPAVFFFGTLAGEVPIDHIQKNALREPRTVHPIMERVMAIHVAEEARHISFADEYLRRRVPRMLRRNRFWLSLYVPIVMRVLCQTAVMPRRSFFKRFGVPRSVRKELFFNGPDARESLRDMFGDVRMLCDEIGLMNPAALLMWRVCGIDGRLSRYRGEPQRTALPTR